MCRWHRDVPFALKLPCRLVLEKMPNGIPYVFESADGETCGRFSTIRQCLEQGAAFAVEPTLRCGRDLEITCVVGNRGNFAQSSLGIGMVARRIVAVRCVEKVYVVAARVETGADDLADLFESRRGYGPAA